MGFVADFFFSTLTPFTRYRIRCGFIFFPTLVSGFFFRIAFRINRILVDGSRIRREKVAESTISGYVWTGPMWLESAHRFVSLVKSRVCGKKRTIDWCLFCCNKENPTSELSSQLSYQANWELVILRVRNIPVEDEGYKWIYESSYIWTAENDMKIYVIIAVIHST